MKDFLLQTIKEAGDLAMSFYGKELHIKTKSSPTDLVTDADVAVSNFITKKIQEKYPDHCIISEEAECINEGSDDVWYIDPIDGTTNYANNIPLWCVMIGYRKNGDTKMSAVYNPVSNQLFFAERGKGAFLNDKKITVSPVDYLDVANVHEVVRKTRSQGDSLFKVLDYLYKIGSPNPKRFGTMLGLCYLAAGAADVIVANCGQDHDFVPPALIAEEAGALVTDIDGNQWKPGKREIICANPILHKKVMEIIHS